MKDAIKAKTHMETKLAAAKDTLKTAKIELDRRQKAIQNDINELKRKTDELKSKECEFGDAERRGTEAEEAVSRARNKLEAIAKGEEIFKF
jgi:peptidoglycan hydrolase CwlO-like protein